MWQNAQDTYLEDRVLSANPVELIGLLYQAATTSVRQARAHLAAGEIGERARAINKTSAILNELASSLDHQRGGEISARLAQLYDYMTRQLIDANLRQSDPLLAEVLGLLSTLSEAWDGVQSAGQPAPRTESAWAPPLAQKPAASASPVAANSYPPQPWETAQPPATVEPGNPYAAQPCYGQPVEAAARPDNPWSQPSLHEPDTTPAFQAWNF